MRLESFNMVQDVEFSKWHAQENAPAVIPFYGVVA